MRIQTIFNKTYITWLDEYHKCPNLQIQIYGISGSGKGIFCENLVETWQNITNGVVVWLVDPKKSLEGIYSSFVPQEAWHKNLLMKFGMLPSNHECKLYHPFSFEIPHNKYLPNVNFYSIPIKNLGKEEFSLLVETESDSETIKVLTKARDNLTKEEGLFAFLHEVRRIVKGKRKGKHLEPDPKNFLLDSPSATAKSIVEASSNFTAFYNDYFLRKESCPYALDWKKILNDNSCYHVFSTKWLAPLNDKIHGFVALSLLQQIIRNVDKEVTSKPILLVIPEILFLCPDYNFGWSSYLSQAFEKAMITMRGKGIGGISSVSDSQSWDKTSRKLVGSASVTFFGKLNPQDLDRVCKARGYNKENRERIMNLKKGQFVMADFENDGVFNAFPPRHCHKEEGYDFLKMYREYYPDKMKRYDDLVNYMRKELKDEEDKIKKEIERRKRQRELEKKQEEKELEEKSNKGQKLTHEIKKAKGKQDEATEIIKKTMFEYIDNPNISDKEKTQRKLSEKFKVGRFKINKWLNERNSSNEIESESNGLSEEELEPMIGEGVLNEEIDENFEDDD